MYDIAMQEMSPEFLTCWRSAGTHLDKQVQGGIQFWLRADPDPPFLEHLSFRLGNQLFFIRIIDVDGKIEGPGSIRGLHAVAEGNQGHACLMPMRKKLFGGEWVPDNAGWGLVHAATNKTIDPFSLVTDEKIEMTPWELQDMAVQVVRDYIQKQGYQLMSWQGNPDVDPALWFVGESKGPEWVVVRTIRYPTDQASHPVNWQAVVDQCACLSRIGHFASVGLANAEQGFESVGEPAVPLWRGHALDVRFDGLERGG